MRRIILSTPVLAALLLTGCGNTDREVAYRDVQIRELEGQVSDLQRELANRPATDVKPVAEAPVARPDNDLDEVRKQLEGSGAEVVMRNGELVIIVADDLLFTPGNATITNDAKHRLDKVGSVIKNKYSSNYLRVEGHTDSDPIRRTKDKWEDNWDLSGARARAVLHYLIDKGGINKGMVYFAGFADTREVASNSSKSGKAKNRRVELVVLPKLGK